MRWDLYLPERSIIVLSREARYDWSHGIDKKKRDYVSLPVPTDQVTSSPVHHHGPQMVDR